MIPRSHTSMIPEGNTETPQTEDTPLSSIDPRATGIHLNKQFTQCSWCPLGTRLALGTAALGGPGVKDGRTWDRLQHGQHAGLDSYGEDNMQGLKFDSRVPVLCSAGKPCSFRCRLFHLAIRSLPVALSHPTSRAEALDWWLQLPVFIGICRKVGFPGVRSCTRYYFETYGT